MQQGSDPPSDRQVLSPAERLRLHQLRTLEWLESGAATLAPRRGQAGARVDAAGPPELWELTRGIDLYAWQQDCIGRWFEAGGRGTVKVVTGAGKTLLALAIAQRLQTKDEPQLRLAIVVPTVVLMNQWYDELIGRGNLPPSLVARLGGGHVDEPGAETRITIAVLATAYKRLAQISKHHAWQDRLLLVVDECHRAGASQMRRVLATPRRWSLGLSATPERELDEEEGAEDYANSLLGREIGPIVYELTLAEAVRLGIVPPFQVCHYGLALTPAERDRYERLSRAIKDAQTDLRHLAPRGKGQGAPFFAWVRGAATRAKGETGALAARVIADTRRRKELLYRMTGRSKAVEVLLRDELRRQPDARAILFHESIDEVMQLFQRLYAAGLPVVAEHSGLSDSLRESSLELFRAGTAQVIASARSLIEGFNVPAADIGLVVASSTSVRQRIQSLGRVLRRHRSEGGEERSSVIHVLYAHGTVDDLIYDRVDWSGLTGLEANMYYLWPDLDAPPVLQEGPPRSPLPRDTEVDATLLKPGAEYPGRYEGEEYSCDHMGNITDSQGRRVTNPEDLPKRVRKHKGSFGRFRVTPRLHHVLVRVPIGDEWVTLFVAGLSGPFALDSQTGPAGSAIAPAEAAAWARSAEPGAPYPFRALSRGDTFLFKQMRGGTIAKKQGRSEVFARVGSAAREPIRGADAERLLAALQKLRSRGDLVSRFEVNALGHAVFSSSGQTRFLSALDVGLEFPDEAETSR